MSGCLREGMYGDLAMAFLKHLPNQELWAEHTKHSPCPQSNQRQRSTRMTQRRSTFMKQHICVCKPMGPCQGDHPMKATRWALLGFDGSKEQGEKTKGEMRKRVHGKLGREDITG